MAKQRTASHDVYLVVVSESAEFAAASHYAARLAADNQAHIGLLCALESETFQHWGSVEAMMRREIRDKTEKKIWAAAKKMNELNRMVPALYIVEGPLEEAIINVVNQDTHIKMLILADEGHSGSAGAMVQHFTSKALPKIKIPVMVVPGHIYSSDIDRMFGVG